MSSNYCNIFSNSFEYSQTFDTHDDLKITIHFMIIERDPEATGKFEITDGGQTQVFHIHNGSFPESYTSKTNRITVKFYYTPRNFICKTFLPCIRFLLQFTTQKGESFQDKQTENHILFYRLIIKD